MGDRRGRRPKRPWATTPPGLLSVGPETCTTKPCHFPFVVVRLDLLRTRSLAFGFIFPSNRAARTSDQPIVRRPAHPRRLVRVLVIGRVAAKPQAQLASAPDSRWRRRQAHKCALIE
jgi:hypothetical protein